jgi:hypothetical protein
MDPRQLLGRLAQLKAEGESIVQQLTASGVPQEAIMAAMQGGGQQPMQPGMGAAFDPSAGVPGGPEAQPFSGPRGPMNGGGGMPPGLLGPM